ncbi:MAG: acylphosphatase [Chitinophagaceae bacterium]
MKTCCIIVSGKVQGVWFRKHTHEKAQQLNIGGTVENQPNGNVKIIATGTDSQLEELITWCKHGPPRAEVLSVRVEPLETIPFPDFRIIRHFL